MAGGRGVEGPVLEPSLSLPRLPQSTRGVRRTMAAAPTCVCCPRGSLSTRVPAPPACSFTTTARRARQVRRGAPAGGRPGGGAGAATRSAPRPVRSAAFTRSGLRVQGAWAARQLRPGSDLGSAARRARYRARDSGSGPSGELVGGRQHAVLVAEMLAVANCHAKTPRTGRMTSVGEDPVNREAPRDPVPDTVASSPAFLLFPC